MGFRIKSFQKLKVLCTCKQLTFVHFEPLVNSPYMPNENRCSLTLGIIVKFTIGNFFTEDSNLLYR